MVGVAQRPQRPEVGTGDGVGGQDRHRRVAHGEAQPLPRLGLDAEEVGDEPLLLSAFASVWVARDRAAGVRAAEAAGAQVILMDDGFQNPAVKPALALVVVDAARGFGNTRCIPAGPLREPVAAGLARADLMLTIGDDAAQAAFDATWGPITKPRLRGQLQPLRMGMTGKMSGCSLLPGSLTRRGFSPRCGPRGQS